jgi:hypothetical protein
MARIFSVLAVVAVLLMAATFAVGLSIGDFNGAARGYREAFRRYEDARRDRAASTDQISDARQQLEQAELAVRGPRDRKLIHFYLGLTSSLLVILVNSITVTYFIGTSRWCKEVAETYQLSPALVQRSDALKRTTFPWAAGSMLLVIVLAALGGLADPSTTVSQVHPQWPAQFVTWHYALAMIATVLIACAFWVQVNRIAANYAVIDEMTAEVRRIRGERNLPIEETAV